MDVTVTQFVLPVLEDHEVTTETVPTKLVELELVALVFMEVCRFVDVAVAEVLSKVVAEAFLALEAVEEVLLVVSLVAFLRKVGDAIGYHQS